jgi:hypothetical protein
LRLFLIGASPLRIGPLPRGRDRHFARSARVTTVGKLISGFRQMTANALALFRHGIIIPQEEAMNNA